MSDAIIIHNASVELSGQGILSGISASVSTGSIMGLLGPSGSGKTTLIRSILGLQRLSSGSISVLGLPAGDRQLVSSIGYVSQSPSVYADLSVEANVTYFARLRGVEQLEVSRVINEVELQDYAKKQTGQLSGGQRARVSLAIALLGQPKILLLDEPTVGLDPVLRQRLWAKFHELQQQGVALVISSHAMDEAEKCDDIMLIRNGQLLIAESKANVLQRAGAQTMEGAFLALTQETKHE